MANSPLKQLLHALPREKGQELRIVLDEYEGHPYVGVRVWQKNHTGGEWFPTKKPTTIRIREIEAVIEALHQAMVILAHPGSDVQGGGAE